MISEVNPTFRDQNAELREAKLLAQGHTAVNTGLGFYSRLSDGMETL